jgi:hypothetical protein
VIRVEREIEVERSASKSSTGWSASRIARWQPEISEASPDAAAARPAAASASSPTSPARGRRERHRHRADRPSRIGITGGSRLDGVEGS